MNLSSACLYFPIFQFSMVGSPPAPFIAQRNDVDSIPRLTLAPFEQAYEVDWSAPPLGVGCTGAVREAVCLETGQHFAVKFLRDSPAAREEVRCHALVTPHPNIVHLHHVYSNMLALEGDTAPTPWLMLVMDLMRGSELYFRVAKGPLPVAEATAIIAQIAEAIAHCHRCGVTHRDIKPENILMESNDDGSGGGCGIGRGAHNVYLHAKLADFGFATRGVPSAPKYTKHYVAPEVLKSLAQLNRTGEYCAYTAACDVWSLGAVYYTLLTGSPPFTNGTSPERHLTATEKHRISVGNFAFHGAHFRSVSPMIRRVISRMLTVNPNIRMCAEEFCQMLPSTLTCFPNDSSSSTLLNMFSAVSSCHYRPSVSETKTLTTTTKSTATTTTTTTTTKSTTTTTMSLPSTAASVTESVVMTATAGVVAKAEEKGVTADIENAEISAKISHSEHHKESRTNVCANDSQSLVTMMPNVDTLTLLQHNDAHQVKMKKRIEETPQNSSADSSGASSSSSGGGGGILNRPGISVTDLIGAQVRLSFDEVDTSSKSNILDSRS